MKLSDYVFRFFVNLGIHDVFYLPGGGAMHLDDSLAHTEGLNSICMLHEQGAAIAAEAYSRISEGPSLCVVTTGPGATNAITGLAGAWLDATPVIFISGQVKRADLVGDQGIRQFGIQEVGITEVVKPLTKYTGLIMDPLDIKYELEKAVFLMRDGKPGPVWLDIPLDVQSTEINPDELKGFDPAGENMLRGYECPDEAITETIKLYNKAERPLILLGNGLRAGKAIPEAMKLIDMLHIPVMTTWNGVDLISDNNPYFFGRPGASGQRHANIIQANADFVLTLGTRLNLLSTGFDFDSFLQNASHVMVEIDENELKKKSVHPTLPVCCDVKSFLDKLLVRKSEIDTSERTDWLNWCMKIRSEFPLQISEQKPEGPGINTYDLITAISNEMTGDDIFQFTSSGTGADIAMQTFRIKEGQRAFLTKGLASMGFDLPASIGSCIAGHRRRTVCVTGDGGFMMNIQELATLTRLNLPVKMFILSNEGYGMIYNSQKGNFGRLSGCTEDSGLMLPDIAKVAEAFGIPTFDISENDSLTYDVRNCLSNAGPAVIICHVNIAQKILPRQTNYRKPDGTMASLPLDRMTPPLTEEEEEIVKERP